MICISTRADTKRLDVVVPSHARPDLDVCVVWGLKP